MSVNQINKDWTSTYKKAQCLDQALQQIRQNLVKSFNTQVRNSQQVPSLMSDITDFEYYNIPPSPCRVNRADVSIQQIQPVQKPKIKEIQKIKEDVFLKNDSQTFENTVCKTALIDKGDECLPQKQKLILQSFQKPIVQTQPSEKVKLKQTVQFETIKPQVSPRRSREIKSNSQVKEIPVVQFKKLNPADVRQENSFVERGRQPLQRCQSASRPYQQISIRDKSQGKIEVIKEEVTRGNLKMQEMIMKENQRLQQKYQQTNKKAPLLIQAKYQEPIKKEQQIVKQNIGFKRLKSLQTQEGQVETPKYLHLVSNKISTRFSKGRYLGKGKFSDVYEAYDRFTQQVVALKIIQKSIIQRYNLESLLCEEIKIQSYLNHPNILKLYGVMQDERQVLKQLIQYEQDDINIRDRYLRCFEITKSKISGLLDPNTDYNSIIHRDLKLENVVVINKVAKLADFGISLYDKRFKYGDLTINSICGTPGYIAPEIILYQQYSFKADAYSLGVLIYEIITFKIPDTGEKYNKEIEYPNDMDLLLVDLLKKLLEYDPNYRITVGKALQHQWIRNLQNTDNDKNIDYQIQTLLQ